MECLCNVGGVLVECWSVGVVLVECWSVDVVLVECWWSVGEMLVLC